LRVLRQDHLPNLYCQKKKEPEQSRGLAPDLQVMRECVHPKIDLRPTLNRQEAQAGTTWSWAGSIIINEGTINEP
jgi:hypothetical protein